MSDYSLKCFDTGTYALGYCRTTDSCLTFQMVIKKSVHFDESHISVQAPLTGKEAHIE